MISARRPQKNKKGRKVTTSLRPEGICNEMVSLRNFIHSKYGQKDIQM